MKKQYPIYSKVDATYSHDGNIEVSDFNEFLSGLIREKSLVDIELGVVTQAHSQGTEILSEKQHYVLGLVVARYNSECSLCGETIPFSERLILSDETNLCSYHYNQVD